MKLGNKLPPPSKTDRRILAASIIVFLAAAVIAVVVIVNRTTTTPPSKTVDLNGNIVDQSVGTPISGVAGASDLIKQMTAMPAAAPLTGPLADEVHALADMVSNCTDYSQPRRDQMNQHIAWLLQPNTIPKEVIIALGTNINGRLIFGMATYTLSDWGQKQKAPASCLLMVGKKLNDMLVANGEARFAEFDAVG